MSATLIADLPPLALVETTRPDVAPLHRALAQAPLGAYPLLEAAYGWQELRPSGWHRPGGSSAAVATASSPAAAARMVSLLSTLTWANVVPDGDLLRVEVAAGAYNRVVRALTGAWRSRGPLLGASGAGPEARQAALGLWRMAMLTGGLDVHAGRLTVRAASLPAAQALVVAGQRLGLPVSADGPRDGAHMVRVIGRPQVHQLLTEATGGH